MSHLNVITREGVHLEIEPEMGNSVMEHIRDDGRATMTVICGGCLSCATCHVYVDDAYLPLLPPQDPDEIELLAGVDGRRPNSRLSCQIDMTEALAGMTVTIAPEE